MKKLIYLYLVLSCAWSSLSAQADELEEVVVEAHPLSDEGLSQSYDVLAGEALQDELQSSLGETVANIAGVRSASFGGAVGRPVIHGLGGPRVKTTEDRIDSLDVSVTSTDHAVTVEPFIADQITILKGASTLLYGSGAIGGVVDTQTGRIPLDVVEPFSGRLELRAADNADAKSAAVRLDGQVNDSFAWHLDAFSKEADDYEFDGYLESAALRALEAEEHEHEEEEEHGHDEEEEHHDEEGEEGHDEEHSEEEGDEVEGSRYDVKGGAIGFAWKNEKVSFGLSVSRLEADYGLVGGHGHEEEGHDEEGHEEEHEEEEHHDEEGEEEEGIAMLDLEQTRVDLEGQWNNPAPWLEKANLRIGFNDYEHVEVEGNGEVGTLFDNDAWEGRLELTHLPIAGFSGAFGVQLSNREFSAIGEEAFVQPVETDTVGVFWVGERQFSNLSLETGIRFENVEHKPSIDFSDEDFSTASASVGLVMDQGEAMQWTALLDYTERAPSIEELYSNGPHLATQAFEIGDPSLDVESAFGLTVGWSYQSDLLDAKVSLYHTRFDDFIYQANTGLIEDELPVLAYRQHDAEFTGADFEVGVHLAEVASGDLDLTLNYDLVNAELTDLNMDLPRIPADRFGIGLSWKNDVWRAKLHYTRVSDQDDVADFELPTDSYEDLDFSITRDFDLGDQDLSLFLHGRNLTDDEQREHVSFVKDLVPAPGRRVEVGLRLNF